MLKWEGRQSGFCILFYLHCLASFKYGADFPNTLL